jgi:hypothetical protein
LPVFPSYIEYARLTLSPCLTVAPVPLRTVVRSVVVTLVGVGNDTFGSVVPVFATSTAAEADPAGGHASAAAVVAVVDDDPDEAAAEDEVAVDDADEQPASRAMPLTATRAGRSRRGKCTEASWGIDDALEHRAPEFLDCARDIRAACAHDR